MDVCLDHQVKLRSWLASQIWEGSRAVGCRLVVPLHLVRFKSYRLLDR